ncbi:MAG: AI-2E family transporter [Aggregatilineales bacterium]
MQTVNRDAQQLGQITRWVLIALAIITFAFAVWLVRDILMLTLTAVIFALLITTPVRFLVRLGMRRPMAVVLSLLMVIVIIVLATASVLPGLIDQFRQLVVILQRALNPETFSLATPTLDSEQLTIILHRAVQPANFGINLNLLPNVDLSGLTQQLSTQLLTTITNLPSQVFPFVNSLASVLLSILVIIFMGLYFVGDPTVYVNGAIRLIPKSYRARAREIIAKVEIALRNFLQAQVLLMALTGLLTALLLGVLGIPLPGALGTLTGILSFIPNFGSLISLVPILAVVILNAPDKILLVIAVYYGLQLILNQLIAPLLVGQEINLPPVVILLAQIIAGIFFGFLGLLLSVPLAAILVVLVKEIYIHDILGDTDEAEKHPPAPAAVPAIEAEVSVRSGVSG